MKRIASFLLLFTAVIALHAQDQQFAHIGDFKLESGGVIRDCVMGYRTFGKMNSAKNNVVIFPTYFGGSSSDLDSFIGTGKIVDSSVYYVIAVDALADGVSSSPSNSKLQARMQFPQITIRDMVNAEHELLATRCTSCTCTQSWASRWEAFRPSSGPFPGPISWIRLSA